MASSTVTNSKYLDYEGLSYLKTVLDARYVNKADTVPYLPLAGGTMTGLITSQSIIPTSNSSYNLGSSSKQFNTTYTRYIDTVSGYNLRLKAGGVEHLNMLGGSVNITANIIPTSTYSLGTSDKQWNTIYGKTIYENGTSLVDKYALISKSFITNRGASLTLSQMTAYADLSTTTTGHSDFQLLKSGSYSIPRSGHSELLINLGTNTGSASALEFLTHYIHNDRLRVRKVIDSNRVSGAFKELAWYSDIPTKVSQLTNDAGYTTANGHTHSYLPLSGGILTGPIALNGTDTDRNLIRVNCTDGDASKVGYYGYTLKYLGSGTGINNALALYVDNSQATTQSLATKWLNDGTMYGRSILPHTNNTFNLGGSSLKWANVYATTFTGNLAGNAYYSSSAGYSATAGRAIYADFSLEADTANYAHTASYAATADSASYAYNIATSNIVTTSTIDTLTDDTVSVVPNIPTSQIVNSGALRQFWVNVRNIIEDNEFVCAAALTDLNTRLDNINASISLSTPVSTTKYNILGSPTNTGNLNTAYCSTSVYMQGNNLYATSDARLKEFKEDIEVDLEKLRKLPKKYFTWKGESMIDIGTSAQELLKLYPELVSYDEVNDVYAVDYVKLSVIALAAVDTLYDRLKSTEDRLKAIEDKLSKLS